MLGILIICVCLLFGLWSYFRFPIPIRVRLSPPTNQPEETPNGQQAEMAEETSSRRQDEPEASASEFQVFLSFRGPDCRQVLADVLYTDMINAGIRVFRDNDELEAGDQISKILPAIASSKICVPIFSKTFASSDWCLREVERMVELNKTIMPIFYTASPDDVKLRTQLFKNHLKKHEKKHGRERVKKWENALKAVGKIIGREVKTTGFGEFSTSFVKALLIKLRVKQKHVTDRLVTRRDHEEAVMRLLNTSAEDVRPIGIYGMGGIGKTTLAKVVFNQLLNQFDCCSFLENIQESLRRHDGLEHLQNKLLEDLNPKLKSYEKNDPIWMLRENFRDKKILIVLDDVNERKQIEMITGMLGWFGPGSRIIITTRDKRVLPRQDWAMEVVEMDNDQALQLFSRHAFGKDAPPIGYHSLSNEVLYLTGRIPLAIEVIGSSLHQRQKNIWRATIEKLKKNPDKGVKEKLKISIDALEYEERQIFLDIACIFISKDTPTAIYFWEACDYIPDYGIDVLVSLSLVKITGDNKFWMHDLMRDLGRELVREECFRDPSKRSRIWTHKEAHKVLRIKQGKENVEGLCQEWHGDNELTNEHFSSFRNLRLLKMVNVKLAGDFEDLLPELKWFSWHQCRSDFATINLSLRNLVVLDLSWSLFSERWDGWSLIQMAKNLKALDLTGCGNLRTTPDLSNNTSLERLSIRYCRCLVELDSSIGRLKRLKHLDLRGCHSLRGLPEDIGSLEDLEEILMDGRGNAFDLPESIGNLCSLSVIELNGVQISRIPDTISGLVNLTSLSMRHCTVMGRLPDAIGDLVLLKQLYLSDTIMTMLPDSIGKLVQLEKLDMSRTKMTALPNSIGNLVKLNTLNLSGTKMTALPDTMGNLCRLADLNLQFSEVEMLPDWVGNLCELKSLAVERTKIRRLPSTLWSLPMLSELVADSCNYAEVPTETKTASTLTYLGFTVSCAADLCPIIDQHPNLMQLQVAFYEDSSVEKQVVLHPSCQSSTDEHLTNPEESSSDCSMLTTLPFDLGALIRLVYLTLDCSGMKGIMRPFPSTLHHLTLSAVTPETKLPDLSNLTDLEGITFSFCSLRDASVVVEGLRPLKRLTTMGIHNCTDELVDLSCEQLESLRRLAITAHPESSRTCLDFSRLKRLVGLHVKSFKGLTEVRGLEALGSIWIEDCISLKNIDELKRRCRQGYFHGSGIAKGGD